MLRAMMVRRIGGDRDTAGAMVGVVETGTLVAASLVL
jgi:hypothetical protein